MSVILSVFSIIGLAAARIGAPMIKAVLQNHVGGAAGTLAAAVVDEIAMKAGVPPEKLGEVDQDDLSAAIREVEGNMPQLISLWQQGLEGQFAMAKTDSDAGGLAAAWRWGWMYLLAFFWICAFLLFPLLKWGGLDLDPIDITTLMTLTGWFISLYMGGHTVKVLGQQAMTVALERSQKGEV